MSVEQRPVSQPVGTERPAGLEELVGTVREILAHETDPARNATQVAQALGPFLGREDLLLAEQTEGDPAAYRQHVLHAEDDGSFSVVALVWLPGQVTPIHDHVSWCVVGVHQGTEAETRYQVTTDEGHQALVVTDTTTNAQFSTCGFAPPGDIHRVRNCGDAKTISIHVYGADIRRLGSSVRREYRMPVVQG